MSSHQTNNLEQIAKMLAQRGDMKFVIEEEDDKYLLFPQNAKLVLTNTHL